MQSIQRKADGWPPQLVIVVELEELPRLRLVANSYEDEWRLRSWLACRATRRGLVDALLDAFEDAA
jgi:hypothetical protein